MRNLLEIPEKTSETEDTLATLCCQGGICPYFNLLPGNPQSIIVFHYLPGSKVGFLSIVSGTSSNSKSLLWGKE